MLDWQASFTRKVNHVGKDARPLGPLTPYIGVWTGSGIDTVPDGKGGATKTPFLQRITLEEGPLLSYGSQTVRALRYSCVDWATDQSETPESLFPVFEECGYFVWIPEENTVALQVSNPRGISMMAIGTPNADDSFSLSTQVSGGGCGVLVSHYLSSTENAVGYEASLKLLGENKLHYSNNTLLKMPDGSTFNQTDITTLKRYSS